ncbi:hypothetical protein QQ008_07670 [Fulvivirgaceae bacterium BMA10]|uniref:Uncharacterized protein n=1 Tax=Splendidivirga corallicola TaxID=3051826 RepID=A0ABT8KKJ9_9BACT|nr:hypothetical protein [Fulvivirgaceae bacterium BMA10]
MDILANITEQDFTDTKGEIPEGFLFASVKNVGNQQVTVNGVALASGEAKSYPFVGKGYQAVPFIVSDQSTLRVLYII